MKKNKPETFETSLNRLKELSDLLEGEDLTLDDSIKYYEEGIKLSRFCFGKLKDAELKITELRDSLEETDLQSDVQDNN